MKRNLLTTLIIAALALPALQGCFPAVVATGAVGVMSLHDRRSTGTQADDESTEWKAAARLPDRLKSVVHVNFTSYNRRLLLTGEVPTEEDRATVEAQARMVDGVREIYNELVVAPNSSLANRSNDSFIDSKVKARLVDTKQISANHIKVVTERAVTYLMGIVNEREAKIAVQVARTTAGVRKVVNLLEIVPESETRRIDAQVAGANRNAPVETR